VRDPWSLVRGGTLTERKNFLLNTIEGALFVASAAFINPQTVPPSR